MSLTLLSAVGKALGKKALLDHKYVFFSIKIGQADAGKIFGKIRYGKVNSPFGLRKEAGTRGLG
jgi:hypothetical protein